MGAVKSKFQAIYRKWKNRKKPSNDIGCNNLNVNSVYNVQTGKITCYSQLPALNQDKTIFNGKYEKDVHAAVTKVKVDFTDLKKTKRELKKLAKKLNRDTLPDKLKRLIKVNQKFIAGDGNILKYFCYEIDKSEPCIYIAAELCQKTLEDYVTNRSAFPNLTSKDVISQMVNGIKYLHEIKIVHRNLKPSKVLIKIDQNRYIVKICGFGVSKQIPDNSSEITQSGEYGEPGYIAPEISHPQTSGHGVAVTKYKRGSDIFSLGAIVYYIESSGNHVFRSQSEAKNNKPDFSMFNGDETMLVLIRDKMLAPVREDRLAAKYILRHPALWTESKTLNFFHETSNTLKNQQHLQKCSIETNASNVLRGNSWRQHLSPHVEKCLFRQSRPRGRSLQRPMYDETSVMSLLRAVRNLKEHFDDLSPAVTLELGGLPDSHCLYWTSKFPKLLIHTHSQMTVLSSLANIKPFYA